MSAPSVAKKKTPVLVPARSAEDWKRFLADPEKQWAKGYSARTLAHCWHEAEGLPSEIRATLERGANPGLRDLEALLVVPEHPVDLPGGRRPSQNDVWALARGSKGLVSIAVEGKVDEPFGPSMAEWRGEAISEGKRERLEFLLSELGLREPVPDGIRYQLLHRTVSALLEARRFGASQALMLVHSFSRERRWFDDFRTFAALFSRPVHPDHVARIGDRGGVELSIGWVCGNEEYLER